jgi:hypothetical protein
MVLAIATFVCFGAALNLFLAGATANPGKTEYMVTISVCAALKEPDNSSPIRDQKIDVTGAVQTIALMRAATPAASPAIRNVTQLV